MTAPPSLARLLLRVALGTGVLLLVPAMAMQFTDQVAWGVEDFLAAGALLFAAGAAIAIAMRRIRTAPARTAVIGGILLVLAAVWAELAVGLLR